MNKLIWIIVLLIWILLVSWICHRLLCNNSADNVDVCDKMELSDGKWNYDGKGNVMFKKSSDALILIDNYMDNGLATVNNYLIDHKDRAVLITGLYEENESYSGGTEKNLGLARANSIKEVFLNNGIKAEQISVNGKMYKSACTSGDTLRKAATFSFRSIQ